MHEQNHDTAEYRVYHQIDKQIRHMAHAEAAYDSIYGRIESGWEKKDGHTVYTVTVPANCTATVRLPDGSERIQEPGTETYTIRTEE